MLREHQVIGFFESHNIPLNKEKKLSEKEFKIIIEDACNMGEPFYYFLFNYVIVDETSLYGCFLDNNELYNFYCEFMTDYLGYFA